ncbi:MAG: Asp-tRNA(Asn)/Glu-tRNA(Gln) amidotransferase subunit GatC [Desulfobacterales bacterium]|nr:Asp-tRNA(Asn)/Glu-tRNA(Gln) amidotransferase subunit GatC [Desulfobacterales bacterium]
MAINKQEVHYVAHLARLDINDVEIQSFSKQIGDILSYIAILEGVDTKDIPVTSHIGIVNNELRDDEISSHLDNRLALANAPEQDAGYFIVPRII